ncbi:MAG: helix-turn-helix domain-containing protein [Gammaproteobacteria bacterium]|nr:helix-turn-helix domain-containing protein [Gammaproteobacteria bacterium]
MMDKKNNTQECDEQNQVDIGALLSGQRERNGVSLKVAAKAINLSVGTIESLESNDFLQIGNSVYVRGYLALYTKYLGLETEQIINVYDNQYPAEPIAIKPALANKYNEKKQGKRHSKTLSFLVALIFFGGLLYGYKQFEPVLFDNTTPNEVKDPLISGGEVESPVDVIIEQVDGAQVIADDALNGLPVASSDNELISDLALNSLSFENSSNSVAKLETSDDILTQPDVLNLPGVESGSASLENRDTGTGKNSNEEKRLGGKSSLVIRFKNKCWLEIKDASGELLASGIYSARKPVTIEGKMPFSMKMARQEAVKELILNGSQVLLGTFKVKKRRYVIK